MIVLPEKYRILIVDDEPDVHAVTRLSLKGLKHGGRGVDLASAQGGKEAVEDLRRHADTAVILLDVVMETENAGLDACRAIREELGNRLVRIMLRTGQPGVAPERKTIEEYDIDGYLPKAELTSNRLFAGVRTALRAFEQLVELERGRKTLSFLHTSVAGLHSFDSLPICLQRVLTTAVAIVPAPFAVLSLETYEDRGNPRSYLLHVTSGVGGGGDSGEAAGQAAAAGIAERIASDPAARALRAAGPIAGGFLAPIALHRDLGHGWIWLEGQSFDDLAQQALPLLAAHAANALYAAVAQAMLAAREGPLFESIAV
jgi:CheY-like chemotaxis protein